MAVIKNLQLFDSQKKFPLLERRKFYSAVQNIS